MRVQIVARHASVPDDVRDWARGRVEKLQKFDGRLSSAELVFDEERHLKKVEGILTLDGQEPAVAQGEGPDYRAAVDQMWDRLGKILRRRRSQGKSHQAPKLSEVPREGS